MLGGFVHRTILSGTKNMPKAATKIHLADLLNGKAGKANADLYKDGDPVKRKHHLKHRVSRARLVNVAGGDYKRSLSGNPEKDIKYHELAREFINNGFNQTKAYASVFGKTISQSRHTASNLFNSVWMRALIHDMVRGTDGEIADVEKEFLIGKLMKQIESNVLDYIDDDGQFLNVKEIKSLPTFVQELIKKLDVHTWHIPVMEDGDDGLPVEVAQIRHQKVHIELYDKQKAMELLAKAMRWIAGDNETNNFYLGAEQMIEANQRVESLRRDTIEGDFKNITPD